MKFKYFSDEENGDAFTFIKILDRERHVATLEYKVKFEFYVNTNKPDTPLKIDEIKRNYEKVEQLTVKASLEKQNKETYEGFTNLPSNFKNIFTNDLLQIVGKNIKEYLIKEFANEFIFAKNSSGHIEMLFGDDIEIIVSSKVADYIPF